MDTGESGTDNGITTLPVTDEEQPVVSIEVPAESGDGDATATEPENPETPSEDEQPAEETKPQDGESGSSTPAVTEQTEAIPDGFFQSIEVGKAYADGKMQDFDSDVDWNSQCAVLFHYTVPEDMKVGVKYTFKVDAPLELGVGFTIYGKDDKAVANGYVGADGESWLKFTDAAYAKKDVSGYFYVGTKFKESAANGGGKQNIDIKIDGTTVWSDQIDFVAPVVKASVELKKDCYSRDFVEDHKIKWWLKVTPSLENADALDSLVVTDPIPSNLEYIADSAKASVKTQDGSPAEGELKYDETTRTLTFKGTGDSLKPESWPLHITFFTSYDVNALPKLNSIGQASFTNKGYVEITAPQYTKKKDGTVEKIDGAINPSNTPAAKSESSKTASITCLWLDKAGSLKNGNTVHWTIAATNGMNQSKPKLVDRLPRLSTRWILLLVKQDTSRQSIKMVKCISAIS